MRDPIIAIEGCWGEIGSESDTEWSPDMTQLTQVLRFQTDGTLRIYSMYEYRPDTESFVAFGGNRVLKVVKAAYNVSDVETIQYYVPGIPGDILVGYVSEDASILPPAPEFYSLVWSFNAETTSRLGVVVDGDWLRTNYTSDEEPQCIDYRYWRRLQCGD